MTGLVWFLMAGVLLSCFSTGHTRNFQRARWCLSGAVCLSKKSCRNPVFHTHGEGQRPIRCGNPRRVCCWKKLPSSSPAPILETSSSPASISAAPFSPDPNTLVPFFPESDSGSPSSLAQQSDSKLRISERACEIYKIYKQQLIYSRKVNVLMSNPENTFNDEIREQPQMNDFPYVVGIGFERNNSNNNSSELLWGCGGSLISDRYVLTTADCITKGQRKNIHPVVVRTRVNDLEQGMREPYDYSIANIIIHPQYQSGLKYFDLALLRVGRPVIFSLSEFPICLANSKSRVNNKMKLIVASWGAVDPSGFEASANLKKAELRFVSLKECKRYYRNSRILPHGLNKTMICAADTRNDACKGSFGGPLVTRQRDGDMLLGVRSFYFGSKPCERGKPDVYEGVQSQLGWIESIVWPIALRQRK